ncbi:molecular chaperone DnaK [Verrucomicrobiota bacterium sgz303538]
MSLIVGIDLGTTNSLIGVMEAGFPILLADADGERLTPSVVYFPGEGEPIVGRAAARMRALEPQHTVYSAKRFIGRRVGEESDDVSYKLTGRHGRPVRVAMRDRELAPEEVSALVLKKLRADAERALEQPVSRAVITVPAYFNDAQRNATKAAGELAGFTVERIVNEPTAAALAYGLDKLHDKAKIAVYDLGGGTFDVSILELNQGVFQVLSTNGNTRLGGDDIDEAIVQWLASQMPGEGERPAQLIARLREQAISAKHRLSDQDSVEIVLPFVAGEQSLVVNLSRAELERLARPIVERTRAHCIRALADAKLQRDELEQVILVGGQTRMPLVRQFVAEIFGREPNVSQNPDEAVAIGATIQAGILSGAVQNVVLLDVTPLSLGIETFGGLMNVIIPRNSTIPCKAGEMFTNAVAGQRSMLIKVLQGEREMARDNWELGQFELEFEPAPKGKARVGVQFEIDANGILHVLARDTQTGAQKVVQMSSAIDVSDEAVEKMLEESLEHAFEDMNERVFTEAQMKAKEMLPAVRKALEQVVDGLSVDERARIDTCVAEVERTLELGAAQPLKKATAALDEATQRLAALLVERAMQRR